MLVLPFLVLVGLAACSRESAAPSRTPSIEFRTDPGDTWRNDTVVAGDTLLVGVVIKRGSDPMNHFKITQRYDNTGAFITTDSIAHNEAVLRFDTTVATRVVPGTEAWCSRVVERDGDIVYRTLTVQ
jgi:hypothetical protein